MSAPTAVVVVPVKSFNAAKGRLAGALDGPSRRTLAEAMASRVVAAAGELPVVVVTDDDDVAEWAVRVGAQPIIVTVPGLNPAVRSGIAWARHLGAERVLVAHGDLPFADDLVALVGVGDEVVIVTDRNRDGTNVLAMPTSVPFRLAYGVGSCSRHEAEADRLGLTVRLVSESPLGWDVDTPDDLNADVLALIDDRDSDDNTGDE